MPRTRPDGTAIAKLPTLRRMMPYLMRTRNEAYVLFEQEIASAPSRELLAAWNASRPPERQGTQFHLLLRAIARTLHEFPRMNRFVAGGRHWQRRGIWIAFSGKQRMDLDAPVYARKLELFPDEPLATMVDRIHAVIEPSRAGRETSSDREVSLLMRLPGPLLRAVVRAGRWLDALGWLPRAMLDDDPLYCSVFVANLGSVGLDAAYHHLFEHGNAPVFVTMGRVHRTPYVEEDGSVASREVFVLRYTFDERTEDGFYAARGLERLKYLLEHPAEL